MKPKLRFPEFNSNWIHDNLENVAEIFDGTHQTPLYTKTGVQFASVENIEDIYKSEKYISHEEYDKYKNKPQINDILMTRITAGVIGETAMVTKDVPLAYYVSLALIRCEKLFPSYVEKYIHSIQFRKELYKRIIHTAFPKKINLGDIGKCLVGITNEQEQQKIAEFLSTIDTVIQKQRETVTAWEERKKGVMQKLFSQEVRFKADDGSDFPDWEEKNFLDCISKIVDFRGRTPLKLGTNWNEEKSEYLALSALNVKKGYIDDTVDAHYGNEELYNIWMKGNELYKGQVLFTTEAPMGNVAQVPDDKPYILSQRTIAFVPDYTLLQDDFLAVLLSSADVQKKLDVLTTGGTAKGVSQKSLKSLDVKVPCLAEQQKIADCLSSLDEVIEKQKATLAAWEELKKGLLQQMFV